MFYRILFAVILAQQAIAAQCDRTAFNPPYDSKKLNDCKAAYAERAGDANLSERQREVLTVILANLDDAIRACPNGGDVCNEKIGAVKQYANEFSQQSPRPSRPLPQVAGTQPSTGQKGCNVDLLKTPEGGNASPQFWKVQNEGLASYKTCIDKLNQDPQVKSKNSVLLQRLYTNLIQSTLKCKQNAAGSANDLDNCVAYVGALKQDGVSLNNALNGSAQSSGTVLPKRRVIMLKAR